MFRKFWILLSYEAASLPVICFAVAAAVLVFWIAGRRGYIQSARGGVVLGAVLGSSVAAVAVAPLALRGISSALFVTFEGGAGASRNVVAREVLLPPGASAYGYNVPIRARLYLPVAAPVAPGSASPDCLNSLAEIKPSHETRLAVAVYIPSNGGARSENELLLRRLAANGFVVAAIDDVLLDEGELLAGGVPHAPIGFWTSDDLPGLLVEGQRRAELDAAKSVETARRLLHCIRNTPEWSSHAGTERAGAFGWSLGGSAALIARSAKDVFGAVVNLDGDAYQSAETLAPDGAPALTLLRDHAFTGSHLPNPVSDREKRQAFFARASEAALGLLAAQPGNLSVTIRGSIHEAYGDRYTQWRYLPQWLALTPRRAQELTDRMLADFLRIHLLSGDARGLWRGAFSHIQTMAQTDSAPAQMCSASLETPVSVQEGTVDCGGLQNNGSPAAATRE